jgi:hypothetical protein
MRQEDCEFKANLDYIERLILKKRGCYEGELIQLAQDSVLVAITKGEVTGSKAQLPLPKSLHQSRESRKG